MPFDDNLNAWVSDIGFSGPMISALLGDRKTMTRRLAAAKWHRIHKEFQSGRKVVLWVRENFAVGNEYDKEDMPVGDVRTFYAATWGDYKIGRWFDPDDDEWRDRPKWTPFIHMPRRLSRLTLLVTTTKIERLQEITCADAIAEGVQPAANSQTIDCAMPDPRVEFRELWESLHGAGSWDENPELVCLALRVIKSNIDQLPAETA